ncbi:hypothetical protein GCM10027431_08280 [Lysobacter rhizosphaerae]
MPACPVAPEADELVDGDHPMSAPDPKRTCVTYLIKEDLTARQDVAANGDKYDRSFIVSQE